jgi:hypothetical protein
MELPILDTYVLSILSLFTHIPTNDDLVGVCGRTLVRLILLLLPMRNLLV